MKAMLSSSSIEVTASAPASSAVKTRALQLLVSLLVSGGFIWYAVRGMDFSRVATLLKTANYIYLLPVFAISIASQLARVWRFRYLAEPVADMTFKPLFRIGNIGMLAVFALPFRLGEFVRPYLMKREYKVSMTAGLAAVAAERVIDGLIVMLGFFAITQSGLQIPDEMGHYGLMALLVFLGAASLLSIVMVGHEAGANFLRRLISILSPKLAERIVGMLVSFAEGLGALRKPRPLALYLFWTLVFWGLNGLCNSALFGAMHLQALPVLAGYLLTAVTVIALMIPGAPGNVGSIQAAMVLGLGMFGVAKEEAFAFSILLHVSGALITVVFGLFSLFTSHLSMSALVKESQAE
jgi:uncharacterized protein (TIRG00374 family)